VINIDWGDAFKLMPPGPKSTRTITFAGQSIRNEQGVGIDLGHDTGAAIFIEKLPDGSILVRDHREVFEGDDVSVEDKRLVVRRGGREIIDAVARAFYRRLASTPLEDQAGRLCGCLRRQEDGQHEPACSVHEEQSAACDCARRG
jgi:hypothetical protein